MKKSILTALAAFAATSGLAAERIEDRWNLADLYPTVQAWNDDAARLDAQLQEFAKCRDRLGESAARFSECLDRQADATRRLYRLSVYVNELSSEYTGANEPTELRQRSQLLGTRLAEPR